jgi:copper homeostasis protein
VNPILEVIACSVSDAIEARKGGANRLEIVRNLEQGGLTPPIELVSEIRNAVDLPLRVMLRENVGYQTRSEQEVGTLCLAAKQFAALGIDGVVLGFLKGERVDVELTQRVLAQAPKLKATFHHAFEDARNQLEAVMDIKSFPQVDRILSSGGVGELKDRNERLATYADVAAPEITILAGGGIDSAAISLLMQTTGIREFHVGRAARLGFRVDAGVSAELVSKLVSVIHARQNESGGLVD